jgi:hypothetical protein
MACQFWVCRARKCFLTGECIDDQHSQPCVIVVDRDYLVDLLNLWLDRKAAYSAAYKGEFCGVGYFYADNFSSAPKATERGCGTNKKSVWLSALLLSSA